MTRCDGSKGTGGAAPAPPVPPDAPPPPQPAQAAAAAVPPEAAAAAAPAATPAQQAASEMAAGQPQQPASPEPGTPQTPSTVAPPPVPLLPSQRVTAAPFVPTNGGQVQHQMEVLSAPKGTYRPYEVSNGSGAPLLVTGPTGLGTFPTGQKARLILTFPAVTGQAPVQAVNEPPSPAQRRDGTVGPGLVMQVDVQCIEPAPNLTDCTFSPTFLIQ